MYISHGSKWTSSLLVFVISVDMLNAPRCLFKALAHSSDTPMHIPQDMLPKVSAQSQSLEQKMGGTQYYIEPWLHGTQVTDASSRIRYKYTSWNSGDC